MGQIQQGDRAIVRVEVGDLRGDLAEIGVRVEGGAFFSIGRVPIDRLEKRVVGEALAIDPPDRTTDGPCTACNGWTQTEPLPDGTSAECAACGSTGSAREQKRIAEKHPSARGRMTADQLESFRGREADAKRTIERMEADLRDRDAVIRDLAAGHRANDPTAAATARMAETSWPLHLAVWRMANAVDHLLHDHECDAHGWEGVTYAMDAIWTWLDAIPNVPRGEDPTKAQRNARVSVTAEASRANQRAEAVKALQLGATAMATLIDGVVKACISPNEGDDTAARKNFQRIEVAARCARCGGQPPEATLITEAAGDSFRFVCEAGSFCAERLTSGGVRS